MKKLKETISDSITSNSMKTMILKIALKSWSDNRLAEKFETFRRKVNKAKQLVDQFDSVSSSNPCDGR